MVNANQALNLFRVFQEAIQNILKHAKATEVRVGLSVAQSGVKLCIEDNGIGMNLEHAKQKANHYGLKNMQERVAEIGGKMEIRSELSRGTCVEIGL